jgi:glycosyltransferase involved in cell wall biosynthesis
MVKLPGVAFLHYSAPPIVGGVEGVILAHGQLFIEMGYPTTMIAGEGNQSALPAGMGFKKIPMMGTRFPQIVQLNQELEQGYLPGNFEKKVAHLAEALAPMLHSVDFLFVHNVFTKHFNLPLTAALFRLLDQQVIRHCIAWCHDFTWTSPHSQSKVFPGYPWDLLRTYRADLTYVTISNSRQTELANLFNCVPNKIQVIPNGVNQEEILGLSTIGKTLIDRMGLWDSDLSLLMPVRVTQAKNIELAFHLTALLKKHNLHPKLIITGPPDPHDPQNMKYFENLKKLRKKLDVENEALFVYESGVEAGKPFFVDSATVGDLYRVSDAVFMPSHREGFGLPVLEGGLVGIPIFCASNIPAANEIGEKDVITFSSDADPGQVADLFIDWVNHNSVYKLRRRLRQTYTWKNIFKHQILPLLEKEMM